MGNLGEVIRKQRQSRNLMVKDLAKELGIHPAYLTQIEKNQRTPSAPVLRKIEKALAIDLNKPYIEIKIPADILSRLNLSSPVPLTPLASCDPVLSALLSLDSKEKAKKYAVRFLQSLYPKKPIKEIALEAEALASSAHNLKTLASKHLKLAVKMRPAVLSDLILKQLTRK